MSREIQRNCVSHKLRYEDLLQESKHINNWYHKQEYNILVCIKGRCFIQFVNRFTRLTI